MAKSLGGHPNESSVAIGTGEWATNVTAGTDRVSNVVRDNPLLSALVHESHMFDMSHCFDFAIYADYTRSRGGPEMHGMIALVLMTLFGIWVVVDVIFWILPEESMIRNGMLPHIRPLNLIGHALAMLLGVWLLILGARRIISRSRKDR